MSPIAVVLLMMLLVLLPQRGKIGTMVDSAASTSQLCRALRMVAVCVSLSLSMLVSFPVSLCVVAGNCQPAICLAARRVLRTRIRHGVPSQSDQGSAPLSMLNLRLSATIAWT